MSDRKTTYTLNFGLLNTVGVVFLVLKLLSVKPVADWGWMWVLSPFWIGVPVCIAVIVLWAAIAFLLGLHYTR